MVLSYPSRSESNPAIEGEMRGLEARIGKLERVEGRQEAREKSLIRLASLWKSNDKAGEYLSGSLSLSSRLLILPNMRKSQATDPDSIAYLAPASQEKN